MKPVEISRNFIVNYITNSGKNVFTVKELASYTEIQVNSVRNILNKMCRNGALLRSKHRHRYNNIEFLFYLENEDYDRYIDMKKTERQLKESRHFNCPNCGYRNIQALDSEIINNRVMCIDCGCQHEAVHSFPHIYIEGGLPYMYQSILFGSLVK